VKFCRKQKFFQGLKAGKAQKSLLRNWTEDLSDRARGKECLLLSWFRGKFVGRAVLISLDWYSYPWTGVLGESICSNEREKGGVSKTVREEHSGGKGVGAQAMLRKVTHRKPGTSHNIHIFHIII